MYLVGAKAGGYTYFYLREYTSKRKMTSRKEKDLFSLGRSDKALKNIEIWLQYPVTLPEELQALGVNTDDLRGWKKKILENEQIFSRKCTHNDRKVI